MRVLVACEESGTVRDAFIRAGHDAWSCDLQPSRSNLGPHYQGDIGVFLSKHNGRFDLCIENPVMHKYARELCGPYTQTIQPWQFGDKACKRTCLWLENLPPLVPTDVLTPPKPGQPDYWAWRKVHHCPPGADRAKIRSEFFPGVARAMAEQWGKLCA